MEAFHQGTALDEGVARRAADGVADPQDPLCGTGGGGAFGDGICAENAKCVCPALGANGANGSVRRFVSLQRSLGGFFG